MIDFRRALAEMRAEQNGTTVEAETARIEAEEDLRARHRGYLPREGVPYLHGEGIRTSCVSGECRGVHLVFEIVPSTGSRRGFVLRIAQGGVTGHEGFDLTGQVLDELGRCWTANALTDGAHGWDGLEVPETTMRRVRAFVRVHIASAGGETAVGR